MSYRDVRNNYLIKKTVSTILLANCFLSGCITVGPDYESPPPPPTDSFTRKELPEKTAGTNTKGGESQKFELCEEIPAEWWELFQSPALDELIRRGMARNPTLDAAQASLKQARENLKAFVGSAFYPAFDANGSFERQRFSNAIFGTAAENPPITFNLWIATINASYNLDLFGGNRRELESQCAQVENKHYLLEAAMLTLSTNIVVTAITEASLREQIKATEKLIRLNDDILKIIQKQYKGGTSTLAEVRSQQYQLSSIRASISPLQKNLAAAQNYLAILVGSLPSEYCEKFTFADLKLPRKLPVSIPSLLVQQRPDIRASEAVMKQTSAEIGVAIANMLPKITITGAYGTEANFADLLFKGPSNIWNYTVAVSQPLFHGGSLYAKKRAAYAAFEEAGAKYRETVLQSFRNVADTLQALQSDAQEMKNQVESEIAARGALEITLKQYRGGSATYISLLNAQRQYENAVISRIQAQALRYTDTANLFQALGGGWWNRRCEIGETRFCLDGC